MIIHVLPQSGIGYVFPCVLLLGASFPHAQTVGVVFPCGEPCSLIFVLGLLSSPRALLAVVSKFVLGHCGLPIHWLCSPLSMLGVGFSFVWDCVSCLAVTWRNCVCCGMLISNLLAEFPCFGTVDCCYHSLWGYGY